MKRYLVLLMLLLIPVEVFAITADEVVKKEQAAFLYPGKDFKARVMMKLISKGGQERVREMTMLRKNYRCARRRAEVFYLLLPAG